MAKKKKTTAKKPAAKAGKSATAGGSTSGRKKVAKKKTVTKKKTSVKKKVAKKKKAPVKKKAATKKKTTKKAKYTYAVGRRKTASARVRLFSGKGETLVNKIPIAEYFPGEMAKKIYNQPFEVCEVVGDYYVTVRVVGSGKHSQLEATVHGIARALDEVNKEAFHLPLKKNGLLTRDSRRRERRKPGLGGRARHRKQSPKR